MVSHLGRPRRARSPIITGARKKGTGLAGPLGMQPRFVRWAMRNSTRNLLAAFALAGTAPAWAGLMTSATAEAFALGGVQHVCDTGTGPVGTAMCSASAGDNAAAASNATATYGSVTAFVQGGAFWIGYGSSATATASFTDTLTFFGGTGTGILSILESVSSHGTGSLDSGNLNPPAHVTIVRSFTFGAPFDLTLSAVSAGNFTGTDCDGGSLLVQKTIESLSVSGGGVRYTDASGHIYNTAGTASFVATPEPSAWVLGLSGIGLVWFGKRKPARNESASAAKNH